MNQSSSIAAALLIGFIVFITLKKQLGSYLDILVGPSGPSGASVDVPETQTSSAGLTGGCAIWNGTTGECDKWYPPGVFGPSGTGATLPAAPPSAGVICQPGLRQLGLC
jgi:hypothetical protein